MKVALVIIAVFVGLMFVIAIAMNFSSLIGFTKGLSSSIVLTADGGETWFALGETEENADFIRSDISTISFNSHDPRIVYAGTYGNGLFKSIDGGAQWYKVMDSNNVLKAESTVYDIVYGDSSVSVESGIQETIYVAAYHSGFGRILRSNDGGFTFKEIYITALEDAGIFFIFADQDTQRLWASTGEKILVYSNDYGETWQRKEEFSRAVPIKMLRSGSELMVTTSDNGLYLSRDNGETWQEYNDGLSKLKGADEIYDVTQDSVNSNRLLLATKNGLLLSNDFGRSWSTLPLIIPEDELPIRAVKLSPMARNTIYLAAGRNMYVSTNAGQTWKVRHILVRGVVNEIAPHPIDPSYVLAGTYR